MRTLGIILLALVSACDDLSPFISEEGLADRLDLDSDGVENARDCAPTDPSFTTLTFWRDLDGDGFGAGEPTQTCPDNDDFALPVREGFAVKAGDCNDGNNTVYPGAREVCDFADNNCDDEVDEGFASHWCRDADEDGYGDANDT
ncbi:hypothetical protein FJZ23_02495, partial [Candidatus Parcubacteria bacterium]|nr:hypothetical protein [Candidatus Parcubacteria bacterium]